MFRFPTDSSEFQHLHFTGILVGGSAGEGVLQSNKERLSVARAFVDAVEGRMVVIVHAGIKWEILISIFRHAPPDGIKSHYSKVW